MTDHTFEVRSLSDDCKVIEVGRVLDNSNADVFSSIIMELYSDDVRHLLVDMSETEFLSSAGIGSILGTVELFRERQGDIMLTNVGDKVLHILGVLDLAEYLTICGTNEEATARCGM